jgi:hypothetical protein
MRDLLRRLFAILDCQESPVSRGMNLLRKMGSTGSDSLRSGVESMAP